MAAPNLRKHVARVRLATAILLYSCGVATPVVAAQPDGAPTLEQFHRTIPKFPYVAPHERAAMIMAGLSRVKRCANKATVRQLLGEPDFGRENAAKGPGDKWIGSSWLYYLTKKDAGANRYDSRVEVFFDTGDRAVWIVPTRVEGAREIGAFGDRCG